MIDPLDFSRSDPLLQALERSQAGAALGRCLMEVNVMPALRTQARIVIVLGILSVIAMGLSHLALTDIAHGEGDVSQEWRVVQVSAAVFLLFTGSSLATLARFLKTMP